MSFRSGAAVGGGALAVAGAVIALAVMLTGHGTAAAGPPSPDAAARLAVPASSAPARAPATSAPSATPRPSHSQARRTSAGNYSPAPARTRAAAAPYVSAPAPSPSVHLGPPKRPRYPLRYPPPRWGWPRYPPPALPWPW
jgi:hypothetical protein